MKSEPLSVFGPPEKIQWLIEGTQRLFHSLAKRVTGGVSNKTWMHLEIWCTVYTFTHSPLSSLVSVINRTNCPIGLGSWSIPRRKTKLTFTNKGNDCETLKIAKFKRMFTQSCSKKIPRTHLVHAYFIWCTWVNEPTHRVFWRYPTVLIVTRVPAYGSLSYNWSESVLQRN